MTKKAISFEQFIERDDVELMPKLRRDSMWLPKLPECNQICKSCIFSIDSRQTHFPLAHEVHAVIFGASIGDCACAETITYAAEKAQFGERGQRQCLGMSKYRRGEIAVPKKILRAAISSGIKIVVDTRCDVPCNGVCCKPEKNSG